MTTVASRTWVLVLASVASLMVALDILAVTTVLSTMRTDLHASRAGLEWTITAYNLSFAVLMMPAAGLGDRFGRRRMFMAGLGVFAAASTGCALAPGIGALIAFRTCQGMGAAIVTPLALALVGEAFPSERRGRALGVTNGVAGLATLAGPLVGGGVTQALGWQWIFWVNVPIGVGAIILTRMKCRESFDRPARLDVPGMLLAVLAAFGVVWALTHADGPGWSDPQVVAGLATGALSFVALAAWEHHTAEPLLPPRLVRNRGFAVGNGVSFCHAVVVLGPVFLMAQYLRTSLGYGPFEAGVRLLPWTVTLLLVAPAAGVLADRLGPRPVIVAGLLLSALGMGWIGLTAAPGLPYADIVTPLVIGGIGNSTVFPAVESAVMAAVDPADVGRAAGANQMLHQLGGVLGIALLAAVFARSGGYASPRDFANGFGPALVACAVIGVVGALVGLAVPGRAARRRASGRPEGADADPEAAGA